ncbi:MAG: hypothetical protein HY070_11095 [Chloroflexi bacterium]|nr:hypothetical protein [Chloroflexota bacterium]MBI3740687.1 hypothetical protein [Chloroflexota bacterium]
MKDFNSRKYQGQVERELIVGGIVITIFVGGGLIWLIWGQAALIAALACFGIFFALCVGLLLFFRLLEIASR